MDGLDVGRALRRLTARERPVAHRPRRLCGFGEVEGEDFRLDLAAAAGLRFERQRNAAVQPLARVAQQRIAHHVLHQGVLEMMAGAGQSRLGEQQPGALQIGQAAIDDARALGHDRTQQRIGEFAADDGADLRHGLGKQRTVEARRKRIAQGHGHQGRRTAGDLGFQDRLGELLHEQRHAVGLVEDVPDHRRRQAALRIQPLDHRLALRPVEPHELQPRDVRTGPGGGVELGTMGDDQQRRHGADAREQRIHDLDGARIGPLGVLEHDQHRRAASHGQLRHEHQRIDGAAALLLRDDHRRRGPRRGRHEDAADRGGILGPEPERADQDFLQLLAPDARSVFGVQVQVPQQVLDDRVKRAVAVIGRALEAQHPEPVRLPGHLELAQDARLAHPGFAGH